MRLDFITSDWGHVFKFEHFWESRPFLNIYQTFERAIDIWISDIYLISKLNKNKKNTKGLLWHIIEFLSYGGMKTGLVKIKPRWIMEGNHIWTISQKCNILYESWYSSHRWPVKISWQVQLNLMLWGSQISSHTP